MVTSVGVSSSTSTDPVTSPTRGGETSFFRFSREKKGGVSPLSAYEALRAEKTTLDENGQAVTTEQAGVYCLVGMEARFKPVEVVYSGDGFALVRSAYDTAAGDLTGSQEVARLRAGDQVIIAGRDLYDGKVLG